MLLSIRLQQEARLFDTTAFAVKPHFRFWHLATIRKAAVHLAATEQIDAAVVDINISGQVADVAADKLIERDIPFLFVSGHEKMRGDRYASIPFLRKPFTPEDLHDAVERVLRR